MTIYMFTGDKGESLFNACLLWYDHRPPDPYNAGTWHVGFSPARRTLMGGWGAYIFLLLSPVILALVTHPYREKDPFFIPHRRGNTNIRALITLFSFTTSKYLTYLTALLFRRLWPLSTS